MGIVLTIQLVLAFFVVLLMLIFTIRNRVLVMMSAALRLAYLVFATMAIVAIFLSAPFTFAADLVLTGVGTKEAIVSLDKNAIGQIADKSSGVIDKIADLFTDEDDAQKGEQGFFERTLYKGMVNLIGALLRGFSLVIGIFGLATVIYLSYATMGTFDLARLKLENDQLKARVTRLEQMLKPNT